MADFVTKVSEKRAIRLMQLFANALARGVVSFFNIQRDDAVGVAGEHARTFGG